MSVENDGIANTWEEVKAVSRRLFGYDPVDELQEEKRVAREYLVREKSEDSRVRERIALPGYN